MARRYRRALGAALLLPVLATRAAGAELQTKHATVAYAEERLLGDFNERVRLQSLLYLLWNKRSVEAGEEVRNKVDAVVDKVQTILEMFPEGLRFRIVLLATRGEVAETYRSLFSRHSDFIAFYAPEAKTVYVSVEDVTLPVLAHEIAHVVIDHYFEVATPVKVHELLAQHVEAQITR